MDQFPGGRVFTTDELRVQKPDRKAFVSLPRHPIHVLLDGVQGNYNLGAIFRLCDAMLVEQLIITGVVFENHKRKFVQAAQGAQGWVPWVTADSAEACARAHKEQGYQLLVADLTSASKRPEEVEFRFPVCLVVGNERLGVSQALTDLADCAIAIPMLGMSNSLNVATATAIVLYQITRALDGRMA